MESFYIMPNKKSSMNVVNYVKVTNAPILSVERGNINKTDNPVIAFSVEIDGIEKKVKALVKGKMAKTIYYNFLHSGKTKPDTKEETDEYYGMEKYVTVSFTGNERETRETEIVLDGIRDVVFNYEYRIIG